MNHKVVIVGAGPAGLGVGVLLKSMGIDFVIIDRAFVGSSFRQWPQEMQLISPSFTGNFFGVPDLNAITPDTSPAFSLQTEHPTGNQYADYLDLVHEHYQLPVETDYDVISVHKEEDEFILKTNKGELRAEYIVWAAGEFQYPNVTPFVGAEHCIHNTRVKTWGEMEGDEFYVIGGYESGIDAAYQLARRGKKVTVIDSGNQLENLESDSSYALSPFTRDRYRECHENIYLMPDTLVEGVEKVEDSYRLTLSNGKEAISRTRPILANGFKTSLSLVEDLFAFEEGDVVLSEDDESTITPGLFLAGPQVKHGGAVFCFIYKYRQRFPIIAETIAGALGKKEVASPVIEYYKESNFYLRDISHCGDDCSC